jgi:hypothetical protein
VEGERGRGLGSKLRRQHNLWIVRVVPGCIGGVRRRNTTQWPHHVPRGAWSYFDQGVNRLSSILYSLCDATGDRTAIMCYWQRFMCLCNSTTIYGMHITSGLIVVRRERRRATNSARASQGSFSQPCGLPNPVMETNHYRLCHC